MKTILIVILVTLVVAISVWLSIRDKQREDARKFLDSEKARLKELHRKYPEMVNKDSLGIFRDWIDD